MEAHAPLGQGLLLVDAHIEEDGLHTQQHATLDLPGQGVKERAWQGDPHVKPIAGGKRDRKGSMRPDTEGRVGQVRAPGQPSGPVMPKSQWDL